MTDGDRTVTGFEIKIEQELVMLREKSNLRELPEITHDGRDVILAGHRMLNLSSNDYLGLGADRRLREEFISTLNADNLLLTASSSRLLTGNFAVYRELENLLCHLYCTEGAIVFNSGYHANIGILPAVSDANTLVLADKLVHASMIDGIRLSAAKCIRYRHNQLDQLASLLDKYHTAYEKIIVMTESIFSMDGDETDLKQLVALKKCYPNVLLYVDEAHALGVRGATGLGCAEEAGCIADIDFLVGTFGKALASVGAFVVCKSVYRELLVNKMRSLIFTTALPPINVQWTHFLLSRLAIYTPQREHLALLSKKLKEAFIAKGYACPSTSHIVPLNTGQSNIAVEKAKEFQRKGYYALPVRPPTVPEGESRIRFSLSADLSLKEIENLICCI